MSIQNPTTGRFLTGPDFQPLLERLLRHRRIESGPLPTDCWIWTGNKDPDGYGRMDIRGPEGKRTHRVNRVSFTLFVGPIMAAKPKILHRCDVRACFRPNHLHAGTDASNIQERDERGRTACGERQGASKLTAPDVETIRALASTGIATSVLAVRYGITPRQVRNVMQGKAWTHLLHPTPRPVGDPPQPPRGRSDEEGGGDE